MSNFKEGEDYYFNREGLLVLTSAYHLKRGKCCGQGCLHCPYQYQNVEEPRRSLLLKDRPPVLMMKAPHPNKNDLHG